MASTYDHLANKNSETSVIEDPDPHNFKTQVHPSNPSYPSSGSAYPSGPYMPPAAQYGQQASSTTTTIILQQPTQQPLLPRAWSSSLCECGRDWSICCCGIFCLCCLESEVARDMNESCMLPCCVPGWLISLRTKMRTQENISGSIMNDCCHVFWCARCSLCQLAYEIKVVRQRQFAAGSSMRPV